MHDLAISAQKRLIFRRNDMVSKPDGLHNEYLSDVVKALDFWGDIEDQTREYLK